MKYQNVTPWAPSQGQELGPGQQMETAIPARPAGLISDLLVPLLQAAVTGAFIGGLVLFGLSELMPDFDGDRLAVFGGVALTVATLTWILLLMDTRRLLWALEKVTGLDLDRDRQVGQPQERVIVVNAGQGQRQAEQRASTERRSQFAEFVAGIPVLGTDARTWEPRLTRPTYQEYRDILLRLGWAEWNSTKADGTPNERRGWVLTVDPAEVLERISG